jgi:predicted ATPase
MTAPLGPSTRVRIIGISGPDGAGKSSLTLELEARANRRGTCVGRTSLYGCVFCRRARGGAELAPSARVNEGLGRRGFRLVHGLTDATELAIRLWVARWRVARRCGPRRTGVLFTDRSPLDGLVKHEPRRGSIVERAYVRLARSYDALLELEAPTPVLHARDAEHDAGMLAVQAARHARVRELLPYIEAIATGGRSTPEVADAAEALMTARGLLPPAAP